MGLWSGIKYALNSTLGTDDFKPLDKIIDESCGVVASDTIIHNIPSLSRDGVTVTIKLNGTIGVKADISRTGEDLSIYKNGYYVGRVTQPTVANPVTTALIDVKYGDTLKFVPSHAASITNIKICGTPYFSPIGGAIV